MREVFSELRGELVPLVQQITAQEEADDSCLHLLYPEDKQLAFGWEIAKQYGYDTNRGRQDKTTSPLCDQILAAERYPHHHPREGKQFG